MDVDEQYINTCLQNFDPEFYLNEYPDVKVTGQEPIAHYRTHGFYEGRKPHAAFIKPTLDFSSSNIEEFTTLPIILYIPTFNNPTYLENFMNQIMDREWIKPVIYDNNSKSSKMKKKLRYYESKNIMIIKRDDNLGPESVYTNSINSKYLPNYFLLSDPDLDLKKTLSIDNLRDLLALSEYFQVGKVGYALKITENKQTRKKLLHGSTYISTFDWEQQFWQNELGKMTNGDVLYSAPIGATFCLINQKYLNLENHWKRGIRISGSRTINHLPWESPKFVPYLERKQYQRLQRHSFYTIPILRVRFTRVIKFIVSFFTFKKFINNLKKSKNF